MSKHQGKQGDAPTFTRESVIKLQNWIEKEIRVRFVGGRQITGVLKGVDTANNMIVDDTVEYIRDINDPYTITNEKRTLGLIFVRGTLILTIGLASGMEEIENPFGQPDEE